MDDKIEKFLAAPAFAVAGASTRKEKYGNKVLRCYLQNNLTVIPVNPREETIEGIPCVASVSDLPDEVKSLSIITPPEVTEQVVTAAIARGVENIWMQPGAESPKAVAECIRHGINIIADGSCILVVLRYRDGH
jgi:predicted CoA-binding protein